MDLTTVPDRCQVVAWASRACDEWYDNPHLALCDTVVIRSTTWMSRLSERYGGPISLLAPAFDADVFQLPPEGHARDQIVGDRESRSR